MQSFPFASSAHTTGTCSYENKLHDFIIFFVFEFELVKVTKDMCGKQEQRKSLTQSFEKSPIVITLMEKLELRLEPIPDSNH